MLRYQLLHLSLLEHVVVPMIYSRLLVVILYGCVDKLRILGVGLLLRLLLLAFVSVMQVPGHEDILSCEFLVLLLVSPDIDEHGASRFQNSTELRESLDSKTCI